MPSDKAELFGETIRQYGRADLHRFEAKGLALRQSWIRVKDEYPDDGVTVLICEAGDQDSVKVGAWHSEIETWCCPFGDSLGEPTHWMHVPEVPLEEVAP